MRILVIEDDPKESGYLAKGLGRLGHTVELSRDGIRGLDRASKGSFDVLVIDRMLPGLDGLAIIETLRARGIQTPILILSVLSRVDDRVRGLETGGDDYLTKPFSLVELVARLEALTRRSTAGRTRTHLAVGDLEMDLLERVVKRGGQPLDLKAREFKLLEYLMRHAGQVVTRSMLLADVWGYHFDPQTNVIDVHISRLRKKIDGGFGRPLLHTVRGAGYVLREDA
jgi:two-component system OmpR family response regulator